MTETMPAATVPATVCDHADHGYLCEKKRYLNRLRRIEGQTRGIHRMVDDDAYCLDVLTQISAVTSALENVALKLLDDHLRHCVVDAAKAGGEVGHAKIDEATAAITRLVKS
ncbi:metal-sensitive transcriptional regulator [Brevibacterium luteolum]|uniref:metal-sensitive transcriptional regulator n=1 Tax=Brevibacterium luteolum TaxID=199591 RepID=UPI001C2184CC|nr:metal-sensitive transcriptional regulator [Brevibacterium luteolum]MBU8577615.1 metal-sensitive transcriptional regulator [Brevibacterium luteolum]